MNNENFMASRPQWETGGRAILNGHSMTVTESSSHETPSSFGSTANRHVSVIINLHSFVPAILHSLPFWISSVVSNEFSESKWDAGQRRLRNYFGD
jgi:hypothetical protein